MYKLDRTAFKVQAFEEADNQVNYWLERSVADRLNAATYLIYSAWNIDPADPPGLNRGFPSIRHRMNNNIFNQDFLVVKEKSGRLKDQNDIEHLKSGDRPS